MAEGGDVAGVRLWWHSHADMELVWSETDCATIGGLPGDFWVAVVANRRGEALCRLDAFAPRRQTWDLPLVEVPDGARGDLEALRREIDREILEKVRAYELVHEVRGNEGLAEVITEYPILLRLDASRRVPEPGDAVKRK
jgi:hypothetical protein